MDSGDSLNQTLDSIDLTISPVKHRNEWPYSMHEEQKKVIQKEMDRLKNLGIIQKGLTGYSSLFVLIKWKNQNLYQVCSDFQMLNKQLLKINHAFPLVRDCTEQLGRKCCHYLSTIDLRDAFHTL